jgi:hypothetical protein
MALPLLLPSALWYGIYQTTILLLFSFMLTAYDYTNQARKPPAVVGWRMAP